MKRVLVTGGAGSIGSYVCEYLIKAGHQVTALDNASPYKVEHLFESDRFRFVQDSILGQEVVERLVDQSDIVIHLAAIADPKRYVTEPLNVLNVNLKGSLIILDRCARGGKKFVFASTSEVMGRNPNVPWKEDADRVLGPPNINRWCYSTGKALIEHYCYAYGQQENLPFVIMRFFNVYGPRCDDLGQGRVIPIFLEKFLHGDDVVVHGDGKQTRCFTYIEDATDAVVKLSLDDAALGSCFNIGANLETSILELAKAMKEAGGFDNNLVFKPHAEVFGKSYEDIPRRIPDVSHIKDVIGWEATTPLDQGLKQTIDFYRKPKA
ncbi:NAD-dependent epimerase/dehydratase family protein [Dethiosulfatarculus sandiegensis]|uniref:Nucleoside-diphosphate sugar epimerase n=1 Tax=Dethiosulfatarculus sandiegensis TaxID=1429043 RepID=A0A0D2J864_9BACT|nr:NAD-dependent epimerase/dehydratase family protein [Dethiosulfatarculus sandiegensis]KIX11896.1 nucleoside-diphosphate sugar epimerase [Dethiosulfatarculus sandiegensis]